MIRSCCFCARSVTCWLVTQLSSMLTVFIGSHIGLVKRKILNLNAIQTFRFHCGSSTKQSKTPTRLEFCFSTRKKVGLIYLLWSLLRYFLTCTFGTMNGEVNYVKRGEYVAIEEDVDAPAGEWHPGAILNTKVFYVNKVCQFYE